MMKFWDGIKNWLNNVAADAVEHAFGYSARNKLQKAVSIVDKVDNKLKNTSVIYAKQSPTDTYFDKVTVTCEADVADIDNDIIKEIEKHNNRMSQTFEYH